MKSLTHDEKRQILEQHFLFGKLSAGEIGFTPRLCAGRTISSWPQNFRQRVAQPKLNGCVAWKHQDKLRTLCQRLRQTTEQVEDVMFCDLKSRVAKALLQLVESVGLRSRSVELHVSQRELGNMAVGSRESVNKILQNWHRRGMVDLGKASILVHDIDALRRVI